MSLSNGGKRASDDTCCDQLLWAAHDANYNVGALVEIEIQGSQTHLAERYEYTPYGEQTIFKAAGSNDTLVTSPIKEGQRVLPDYPHNLCEFGHQGLLFDKEFGLYHNRARYLNPTLGRFSRIQDSHGFFGLVCERWAKMPTA